jgi:hypothetical protein
MSLDYKEFETLLNSMKNLQHQHEVFIRNFLKEMGLRALAQTKKLTPVDTGHLRELWELSDVMRRGDELYIVLFNPAEYASFVEDGHMQRKHFLPIKYLEDSKNSRPYLNYLYEQYGDDVSGIMLKDKWIPGVHMARISITKIEFELPQRYEKALQEFVSGLGVC